jgi:hypothetical protein
VFYGFEWVRTRDLIRRLLLDDIESEPGERSFGRTVDPHAITEQDLREFGDVMLGKLEQRPLQMALVNTLKGYDAPVVVDSIRSTADVSRCGLDNRPVLTWFVDCNDAVIQSRMAKNSKLGEKRIGAGSPVDRTASAIRKDADQVIPNSGTLEELRWCVDDTLFSITNLRL